MPGDLSSYIGFTVEMNIQNRASARWVLTDNGTYPMGVAAGITGIFKIIQPDGGIYSGTWSSPDVVYSAGALQPASIVLRLATGLTVQPGTYTIVYIIDHASYSPTTLTKTFTITYASPTPSLDPSIDVFTPIVSIDDDTIYSAVGYTIGTVSRAWSVVVGSVGTVTGTSTAQNVAIGGNYYDAAYAATLVANFLCTSTTYSYLTVRDRLTTINDFDAWRPPTATQLLGYITTLKTSLDALNNTDDSWEDAQEDYEYAYVLYRHIKDRVCSGDTVGVYTYIQEILDILHNHQSIPTAHTNTVIAAYDFPALCSVNVTGAVDYFLYICTGTELSTGGTVYFSAPDIHLKTCFQISLDGTIRKFNKRVTPLQSLVLPDTGEFTIDTWDGIIYYTPLLMQDQYIYVLYY